MAARFVVGLALVALCHSSPVLINGVETRDGRSLSTANGFASGYGGENTATANVAGNTAHSTGISSGNNFARDGLAFPAPGQALANAQIAENQYIDNIARLQGYYPYQPIAQPLAPQPLAYNQIPAQPVFYSGAPATAESSAVTNQVSDLSRSSVNSHGTGNAESTSHTAGSHGITNTNAKTFSGYNSAASNANTASGIASVSSKAVGSGLGDGFASSNAETKGYGALAAIPAPAEVIVEQPAVIAVKNNGFYNPALYNSAPLPAALPARRSISWRFGTAYDAPAAAPVVYQTPVVYQQPIAYEAVPVAGNAKSDAFTQGAANAASLADINGGLSQTQSAASSGLNGNAKSNANINSGYSLYRSGGQAYGQKSSANTIGLGAAGSNANVLNGNGNSHSFGTSQGGHINANSDISNNAYGLYRSGEGSQWSRTNSNIAVNGFGNAESNAQALYGVKRADSKASSTWGSSAANSQSL